MDRLLSAKSINSMKDLLRETAKQAGTEASEEMLTEISNILTDTAIMGETSNFQQAVDQYRMQGLDDDDAKRQAVMDSIAQVLWAGAGGALSGAAMGGATRGMNLAARNAQDRRNAAGKQTAAGAQAQQGAQGQAQSPQITQAAPAGTQNAAREGAAQAAEANLAELERSAAAAGVAEADVKTAAKISRATGREIRFYDGITRRDPSARANGYFDGDTIYVNSRSANPVAQIISHELTHSVEMADAYRDLSSLVFDRIQKTGGNLEQLRQEKRDLYDRMGANLHSQEMVDQEIVAEYVEHNLLTNEQEILDLTRENPTLGRRIMDWIDRLLARLGNADAQERAFLTSARDTYARALEQTGTERATGGQATQAVTQTTEATTRPDSEEPAQATPRQQPAAERPHQEQPAAPVQEEQRQRTREEIRQEARALREDYNAGRISDEEFDEALDAIMEEEGLEDVSMLGRYSFGNQQYSIDENYERDIDDWDRQGRPDGETFILGATGDVLQGLEAMEQDIYLRSEKVNAILRDHPEMTLAEIKRIPEILDDPVLVLKSRNVGRGGSENSRMVIFGTVTAQDGRPILVALDLMPTEGRLRVDDMQKVTSAYTKDTNPVGFLTRSEVLYADKKEPPRFFVG